MAQSNVNVNPDIWDIKNVSYANLVRNARLSSGHTYRYVFSAPLRSKPTLLFLHGWPESSYSFVNQIEYFSRQGYGLLVPDLLGTGGTDDPKDLESFTWKRMANEICGLLDCEDIRQVVGVSHDLGSTLLSRIQHYSPDRLSAIVFLGVGYTPPGVDMNSEVIANMNDLTRKELGHPVCEFWNFNARDDAGSITDLHLDSLYSLVYHTDDAYVGHPTEADALERWLRSDSIAPFHGDFVSDVTLAQWRAIAQAQGGSDGQYNWFRAMMRGVNTEDEKVLREDLSLANVSKPSLIIVADRDRFAIPSIHLKNTTPFFSCLTVRTVNSGHFVHTEAAPEVNRHLHEFLKGLKH